MPSCASQLTSWSPIHSSGDCAGEPSDAERLKKSPCPSSPTARSTRRFNAAHTSGYALCASTWGGGGTSRWWEAQSAIL